MEHRCGTRRTLSVGVKLYTRQSPAKFGRLLNASASGAYVAMGATPPLMTRVQIALGWDSLQRGGRHRIAAYVVRVDARGIGVEWRDFAPAPVLALIQSMELPPALTMRHATAQLRSRPHAARAYDSFGQRAGTLQAGANGG